MIQAVLEVRNEDGKFHRNAVICSSLTSACMTPSALQNAANLLPSCGCCRAWGHKSNLLRRKVAHSRGVLSESVIGSGPTEETTVSLPEVSPLTCIHQRGYPALPTWDRIGFCFSGVSSQCSHSVFPTHLQSSSA